MHDCIPTPVSARHDLATCFSTQLYPQNYGAGRLNFLIQYLLPFNTDLDLAVWHLEEAAHEKCPFQHKGSHEHVKTDAAIAITLKERHQETKTNEDHHMDILEH